MAEIISFKNIPPKTWKRDLAIIRQKCVNQIMAHYLHFGENYLKEHRPDNDEFYGFKQTYERLPLVLMHLLDSLVIEKTDETHSVSYNEDGNIVDVSFTNEWDMIENFFKLVEFLESKPTYKEYYQYAKELSDMPYTLMWGTCFLTPTPSEGSEYKDAEKFAETRERIERWIRKNSG